MEFAARARPMTREGLAAALETLRLNASETAALWAVFEVETGSLTQGFGFRADRRPQLLFERHIFHRETGGAFDASHPAVSAKKPGGYGTVGSSRVDLQACKLEYSIVSPK